MQNQYDVVVVGARVAGASTAMLLARAGLKVALLDRGGYGSDTLSTHALMRAGVLQLSRWGVLDEVVAAGTPPVEKTLFHYSDGDMVQVSIRSSAGVDALYAPRRYVIDRILVDAAAAAGVDVHHGVAVTGLSWSDGRVTGLRAVSRTGAALALRARLVVGADGIRSVVAQQVGAPVEQQAAARAAVLFRYHADFCLAGYEWAYGGGAAAGMIPTNDDLACVFVSTTPERLRSMRRRAGTERAFAGLFEEAAPDLAPRLRMSTPAGRMLGWAGVPGFVRRSWGPGWALVGDAGYFKDPITAHGMTDAMRDAELLANAVVEAMSGARPEAEALAAYQRQRDALSSRLLAATEAIAAYAWDMSEIRQLLREVSSAMTDEVEALEALPTRPSGRLPAGQPSRRRSGLTTPVWTA
ncbi:MAG TPA: NAD(P)/FAD-dependent oxidoreductase [Nocardioidaceae bacterium]|nr:NAD(P)/FAD-dependent oxidoreductase [Nocardioidaceae bacterium]